jgi:hypothetical protein
MRDIFGAHTAMHDDTGLDERYHAAVRHLNRREWEPAITALAKLEGAVDGYPDVAGLLADAQLKLKFEGVEPPVPAMRPSKLRPIRALLIVVLCLVGAGLIRGAMWSTSGPPPVAAAAKITRPRTAPPANVTPAAPSTVPAAPSPRPTAPAPQPATILVKPAANPSANIPLSYQLLTPAGMDLTHGTVGYGRHIELSAGTYVLKINAKPAIEKKVVVASGATVEIRLRQGYSGWVADVAAAGEKPAASR